MFTLFLDFTIGTYKASFLVVLIWIATIVVTIIFNRFIKRILSRYLKKPNIKIKGTRITLLRVLNQVLYLAAFVVGFQAFRLENENISIREFLSYDIVPKMADGKFHLSRMNLFTIIFLFDFFRFILNIFKIFIVLEFKGIKAFDEGRRFVIFNLRSTSFILLRPSSHCNSCFLI